MLKTMQQINFRLLATPNCTFSVSIVQQVYLWWFLLFAWTMTHQVNSIGTSFGPCLLLLFRSILSLKKFNFLVFLTCLDWLTNFLSILRMQFWLNPRNSGSFHDNSVLEERDFRINVRKVKPNRLTLAINFEAEEIRTLKRKCLKDMSEP